jgi:amidase
MPLYLKQIDQHNNSGFHLNALISVSPIHLLQVQAQVLNIERANGNIRSTLHGVPVFIKDSAMTHPELGMDTPCDSHALVGARAVNALIMDKMLYLA